MNRKLLVLKNVFLPYLKDVLFINRKFKRINLCPGYERNENTGSLIFTLTTHKKRMF